MKLYVVNGRVVTEHTRWWLLNEQRETRRLYCIHHTALDRTCRACEQENAA